MSVNVNSIYEELTSVLITTEYSSAKHSGRSLNSGGSASNQTPNLPSNTHLLQTMSGSPFESASFDAFLTEAIASGAIDQAEQISKLQLDLSEERRLTRQLSARLGAAESSVARIEGTLRTHEKSLQTAGTPIIDLEVSDRLEALETTVARTGIMLRTHKEILGRMSARLEAAESMVARTEEQLRTHKKSLEHAEKRVEALEQLVEIGEIVSHTLQPNRKFPDERYL